MDARAAFHRRRTPPQPPYYPPKQPPPPLHSPTPHPFHGALYESVLAEVQYWWEFRFQKRRYKNVNVVSANLLTFFFDVWCVDDILFEEKRMEKKSNNSLRNRCHRELLYSPESCVLQKNTADTLL